MRIEDTDRGLSHSYLKSVLYYDPWTGVFTRLKQTSNRVIIGDDARVKRKDGYYQVCVQAKVYLAHRLAWFYVHGVWPKEEIDHKNRDPSDNRIANLREATSLQNKYNGKKRSNNTSGFIGVCYYKAYDKWTAAHTTNGVSVFLGYFDTAEEASAAYQVAIVVRGEFAYREAS
jgi:hypothetical protein